MPDYELLELVLFRAIARQDVKPLARALIDRFGDFNAVLSAAPSQLTKIKGCGPAVVTELKIVEAAAHRLARARVMQRHVISSWDAVLDYCHTVMSHRDTEQFRILFLDTKNALIADEEQAKGTVDHVPVYPREVVKRALELNAASIILVHNHPSGDPTPSDADISMTHKSPPKRDRSARKTASARALDKSRFASAAPRPSLNPTSIKGRVSYRPSRIACASD